MEIMKTRILRGPNYWSNYRDKLIVLKLNLLEYENLPTNKIKGFTSNLKELIPSLYNHRCSLGVEGGFFTRLEEGTWLGHVIEHIALELQWLAGMECGFGRTRPTSEKGIYNVVFSYQIENAGLFAANAAFNIAKMLAEGKKYNNIKNDIYELRQIFETERLGPSTESIVKEAEKRGIPYKRLDKHSLVMLGQGCCQKIICSTVTSETSCLGAETAADKENTKELLASSFVPVPKGIVIKSLKELDKVITELEFPLVIKPQCGNHGKGITTNIVTHERALCAFKLAKKFSNNIIVEKFIQGFDYRLLVINFKLVAVAKRTPACIIGTGVSTIRQLIQIANEHPDRGEGHQNYLTKIKVDKATLTILADQGLSLQSILPMGKIAYLKSTANISSGGTAVDVTHLIHPHNIFLAERIARLVQLDICGIDLITTDISVPLNENNGAILEVNAGPGLRMHIAPIAGMKRNIAKPIIDMLYPKGAMFRIPLVAVTGTNGKTTIVRLIAYLASKAGYRVGFTTTEGVYIQNNQILKGDCSGPESAAAVLRDPIVNFAVFECARGGIIRSGLGFDRCSISIVSNISKDHLGQDEIVTLTDMARVKSVVARSTLDDGYSILNADDDLVYAMKDDLTCQIALFSMFENNERIKNHCSQGGLAAYVENEFFIVQQGDKKEQISKIIDLPITYMGFAKCMVKNILPAVLMAVISHFSISDIRRWLSEFEPSIENIPGRMNLFDFPHFKVLVDYAHNEQAFIELRDFFTKINCRKKVGIIAATGDRLPADIKKVGYYAAQTFDEIIIRQDKDSRGKSHGDLNDLMISGMKEVKNNIRVRVIPDEFEAIQYAIDNAEPDSFIMYFPDEILKAVKYVKQVEKNFRVNGPKLKRQMSA